MISTAPDARSSTSTTFRNIASSSRPNSFSPSQVPANSAGNPIRNSLIDVRRDRALGADPQRAHQEDRDRHRLKNRALHVLGPAAQAAPDGDEDSGKPGDAAEHAVEESDAGVGRRAARLHRGDRRPKQCIEAVEHQKGADADAHMGGVRPGQDADADGYAERGAEHERPESFPVQARRSFQTE